jgi:hypothetical protein
VYMIAAFPDVPREPLDHRRSRPYP